ncbi:conserved hypothetical protein [Beijerinckia indica subsp. indica ATCC 9039]|uniref:DUF1640 domain-containing protein n=2 Tax=Beijerinckia TaxID=532 RepID=B2IJQ8_BEII9|nr:conserved hypothetical protein [Beijerinckia indica subsp. indica ATCC 9039]
MSLIPFDTLKLARDLRDRAHFSPEQAEGAAAALADAFQDLDAKKSAIDRIDAKIEALEQRLTIKIGSMLAVAVGVSIALAKLVH